MYMNSLEKSISRNTFIGNFPHKEHLLIRFKALEYICNKSNEKIFLSIDEINFLCKLFVFNDKSGIHNSYFFYSLYKGIAFGPLTKNFEVFKIFLNKIYFSKYF